MKKSSVSAKSKGILAFASNTPDTDYERIGHLALDLARHHLDVPVRLIMPETPLGWNNYRMDVNNRTATVWNNHGRFSALSNSPWDETIVIDVDYLVLTDRLRSLFDSTQSLLLCHDNSFSDVKEMHTPYISPVWATVFYFKKNSWTEQYFDLVGRIQRNWDYYRMMFGVTSRSYRNDYAFAIAELVMNGYAHGPRTSMPFGITTMEKPVSSMSINDSWLVVRSDSSANIYPRQDIHVMDKHWLQSMCFEKFVQEAKQ
jgi:hypothetical protein